MMRWTEAGKRFRARIEPIGARFPLFGEFLRQIKKSNLFVLAGSLAYTTVLSLIPFLAVVFYVFRVAGGFEYAYRELMPFLLNILSEGTGEVVQQNIGSFVQRADLKAVGWLGFAGLFLTSTLAYLTVVKAFSRIWDEEKPSRFQHRMLRFLILLTVGPILLLASIMVTTAVAARVKGIPFSGQFLAFLLSYSLFTMVYALIPMVKISFKTILIGSILPAALLETAKFGYAIYTSKMVSYSAFYGSFAAIPLFLLWIYIAWCITLLGAAWVRTLQLNDQASPRKRAC